MTPKRKLGKDNEKVSRGVANIKAHLYVKALWLSGQPNSFYSLTAVISGSLSDPFLRVILSSF